MNASEKTTNFQLASQIAATVNLFKSEFPDIRADLKPWTNDPETRKLVDPDSIDIGFHFPGKSRLFQCRSILVQIRFYEDPFDGHKSCIGVETAGYDHQGQQWRFSTIESWRFVGVTQPDEIMREKLKLFCRQILELFNGGV
jgi:hypothetical protein